MFSRPTAFELLRVTAVNLLCIFSLQGISLAQTHCTNPFTIFNYDRMLDLQRLNPSSGFFSGTKLVAKRFLL
ncbi:hypothetical protein EDB89DRAFT_729495 [Lactarius sanguifluus]|nr:hypothetical protein EDB89DRAFT_729495 [Lactarius sanguifluus]